MTAAPTPLELLKLYVDAGADEAIGDVPHNRFAETEAAAAAPQRSMTIRRIDFVKLSIFTVMSILTASGSIPDDPSTSASGFGS